MVFECKSIFSRGCHLSHQHPTDLVGVPPALLLALGSYGQWFVDRFDALLFWTGYDRHHITCALRVYSDSFYLRFSRWSVLPEGLAGLSRGTMFIGVTHVERMTSLINC